MADVTFERADYKDALTDWNLSDDVMSERKIKAAGKTYLPVPNPHDTSPANEERYKQYAKRACFFPATARTLAGLIGSAFTKVPVLEVPDSLSYVEEDVDGCGVSIYQQSQKATRETMKKGRAALYVDYPNLETPVSRAQQESQSIRAKTILLDAKQVTNWRIELVGGIYKLTLVVIKEAAEEVSADGFGVESVAQYRVLRLEDGVYTVEVWQQVAERGWQIIEGPYAPTDGAGRRWNEIPFTFIGAENNDTEIDKSPLLDIATVNVAHYRNSADYEDSVFFCGQAQPWLSGLDTEWRDHLESKGLYVGSRAPIALPAGGQMGFAQAQPNLLVKEAMDQKEAQMVALGARLIERGSAVKTATEAQSDSEKDHSVLSLVVSNVSEAYTKALMWMAQYMNAPEQVEYTINQEFTNFALDAQMLTALTASWQSGGLPASDYWKRLQKAGVIDPEKDEEAIKEEIETSGAGLSLVDAAPGNF